MMAEQVHPAHFDPFLAIRFATKTAGVIRRKRARIPSWLEADPSLHLEAAYIEADRFFHRKILLAIRRRTIHMATIRDKMGHLDYAGPILHYWK